MLRPDESNPTGPGIAGIGSRDCRPACRSWLPLAAACLLQGCLERKAAGSGVIFSHSWGPWLLVVLAIVSCTAVFIATFAHGGRFLRRVGALSLAGAVTMAIVVLPPWLLDRIEFDPAGIKLRVVSVRLVQITRYEASWKELEVIRLGSHSVGERYVNFSRKGTSMEPTSVFLDNDDLDAILPDLTRLARSAGVRIEDNL